MCWKTACVYHTGPSVCVKLKCELHLVVLWKVRLLLQINFKHIKILLAPFYFPFLAIGFHHTQNCWEKAAYRLKEKRKEALLEGHGLIEDGGGHKERESSSLTRKTNPGIPVKGRENLWMPPRLPREIRPPPLQQLTGPWQRIEDIHSQCRRRKRFHTINKHLSVGAHIELIIPP